MARPMRRQPLPAIAQTGDRLAEMRAARKRGRNRQRADETDHGQEDE
jgi:hypothetical protein